MGVIFLLSAQRHLATDLGTIDLVGRKVVHAAEYALLCFLWWRALRSVVPGDQAILLSFAIASGYAATDELHQGYVSGRHAAPLDWAIDTGGAGLAALRIRAARRRAVVR
jgi:VanZ family protein